VDTLKSLPVNKIIHVKEGQGVVQTIEPAKPRGK
jgi:hypothetical protein